MATEAHTHHTLPPCCARGAKVRDRTSGATLNVTHKAPTPHDFGYDCLFPTHTVSHKLLIKLLHQQPLRAQRLTCPLYLQPAGTLKEHILPSAAQYSHRRLIPGCWERKDTHNANCTTEPTLNAQQRQTLEVHEP